MAEVFGWLRDLFGFMARCIPHLGLVRATHCGVKFRRGKQVKVLEPGLFFWWPLVTEIELIPAARQTINLPPQVLVTRDGRSVVIGAMVVFRVVNARKALASTYDFAGTIHDEVMAAITTSITQRRLSDLLEDFPEVLPSQLTHCASEALGEYGVEIIHCTLTDLSPCFCLRNIGTEPSG